VGGPKKEDSKLDGKNVGNEEFKFSSFVVIKPLLAISLCR
jgi:hypothetical protein